MKISLPFYSGIRPVVAPQNLGLTEAQTAENCKLFNGNIRPWNNYLFDKLLVNKGIIQAIYLYENEYWLEWEAEVDLIEAPVSGDTSGKIFWTGEGVPKKANRTMIISGSGALPGLSYPLTVPSPVVAISGSPTGSGGTGDDRYVSYIWTVVTEWGEESYPSPASATVTAKNGEQVDLSAISMEWIAATAYTYANSVFEVGDEGGTYLYKCIKAGTSDSVEPTWNQTIGGYTYDGSVIWQCFSNNLLYKRIYRLLVGDVYSTYQFVTEIAISTDTYSDSIEDLNLSNSCPTLSIDSGGSAESDYDPLPDGAQGLCYIGNGIALAFIGKDLYASIPYKIWAFPIEYSQSLPTGIVSVTPVSEGVAIISTTKKLFIAQGTTPGSITIDPLAGDRPNLSKRGAVPWGTGVIYPAADGLRYATAQNNQLLTEGFYSQEEWENLYPSTMIGAIHNEMYFGFYKYGNIEGAIIFNLSSGKPPTTLDFYCTAVYVDPNTDKLYFIRSTAMSQFKEFFQNPDARTASGKATQYDLTGGAGVMAGILQPDYPRNAVITLTDANASISALSITIAGTLADGTAGSETKTDLVVGENDLNYAFAQIDSITINSVTGAGAGDVIDIGWGKKFGLGNSIDAESDVIKVLINDNDSPVDDQTISTVYDTIEFTTDPDGSNDYMVMYVTD